MAKRVFSTSLATWTATALGSAATQSQFMALKGGSTTQIVDILEILVSGMATSSTLGGFTLVYASTLETGGQAALASPSSDGPMNVNATALASPVLPFIAGTTTAPTPASTTTLPKLNLGLNLFGGIVRWVAAPTQQWTMVGNATNGGESVLFNSSSMQGANGAASAHIVYEPY